MVTSPKKGGVIDLNYSIDSVASTDSNSDCNAASDIASISISEKLGITNSVPSITASTLVSVLKQFPARTSQYHGSNYLIQQPRRIVLKEIPITARPTHYSNVYNLFHLSSFNKNGCKFPKVSLLRLDDKIHSQVLSVSLPDYFQYCLFECAHNFCRTHLNCCTSCGVKSHSICSDKCSDYASSDHFPILVLNCYYGYMNLIHHII